MQKRLLSLAISGLLGLAALSPRANIAATCTKGPVPYGAVAFRAGRSRYWPHQGEQEKARRVRQAAKRAA